MILELNDSKKTNSNIQIFLALKIQMIIEGDKYSLENFFTPASV
jgi:hypothetical protein